MLSTLLTASFLTKLAIAINWRFPDDFKFGVATSAYQIEGGWDADGKGISTWDYISNNRTEIIRDHSNGNMACNSYNKWEKDVMMIKNLGVNYYRFSLSWTRLFPDGFTTKLNQAGVNYYNKLINRLLSNEIEPVVTLVHFDLPQVFSPLGGWTNPVMIDLFASYARRAFELFGDRVKIWVTINEPRIVCEKHKGIVGDIVSVYASGTVEYLCAHNVLKAHAEAYHIYDKEFRIRQKGKVSLTLDSTWYEPLNISNPEDVAAAEQFLQFEFGLFANPVFNYDYPQIVKDRVAKRSKMEGFTRSRLPSFTLAEKLKIRGTFDYVGINHYPTYFAQASEEPPVSQPLVKSDMAGNKIVDPTWEITGVSNYKVVPWGLRRTLQWIKKTYNDPDIMILENGYADANETLEDDRRINFYKGYMNSTLQAILEDGVKVKCYITWSLMDNFEWKDGYTAKFGLYHVNFTDVNRTRTPKKSVEFFKNVVRTKIIE